MSEAKGGISSMEEQENVGIGLLPEGLEAAALAIVGSARRVSGGV